jgi:hypothetical protein
MPKKQSQDIELEKAKISARTTVIAATISGLVTLLAAVVTVVWGPIILHKLTDTPTPTIAPTSVSRNWYVIFEHSFPPNYWSEGVHKYLFKADCPFIINSTKADEPSYSFSVKDSAPIQNSKIYIRRKGLYDVEMRGTPLNISINTAQETVALYGPLAPSFEEAKKLMDSCKVQISIDDGAFIDLTAVRIDKLAE